MYVLVLIITFAFSGVLEKSVLRYNNDSGKKTPHTILKHHIMTMTTEDGFVSQGFSDAKHILK